MGARGRGRPAIPVYECQFDTEEIRSMYAIIAANVERLRKEKGYSQERLAMAIGVSRPYIYRCERAVKQYLGAKYTHYSVELLYKISVVLGCDINEFFIGLNTLRSTK